MAEGRQGNPKKQRQRGREGSTIVCAMSMDSRGVSVQREDMYMMPGTGCGLMLAMYLSRWILSLVLRRKRTKPLFETS